MARGENPAKRSRRYAKELKAKRNSFTGRPLKAAQAGFRMGRKTFTSISVKKMINKHSLRIDDNRFR